MSVEPYTLKNRSKNVVEYGSRPRSTLKKPNAPKVARWCKSSHYL